jgi:phosphatidylserine decarboxylase
MLSQVEFLLTSAQFTRLFRFDEGIRPIAEPENDNVVVNSCESMVYK